MDNIKERLEHLREYLRMNIASLQQKVDGRTSNVNFEDDIIELSLTGRQLELLHDSLFVWLNLLNMRSNMDRTIKKKKRTIKKKKDDDLNV